MWVQPPVSNLRTLTVRAKRWWSKEVESFDSPRFPSGKRVLFRKTMEIENEANSFRLKIFRLQTETWKYDRVTLSELSKQNLECVFSISVLQSWKPYLMWVMWVTCDFPKSIRISFASLSNSPNDLRPGTAVTYSDTHQSSSEVFRNSSRTHLTGEPFRLCSTGIASEPDAVTSHVTPQTAPCKVYSLYRIFTVN